MSGQAKLKYFPSEQGRREAMVVGKLEEVGSCVTRNLWAMWWSVVSGVGGVDTVSPEKTWQQQGQQ